MNFSTNQGIQFYVVSTYGASGTPAAAGELKKVEAGKDCVSFAYMNAKGDIERTDIIEKKNVISAKITEAEKQEQKLHAYEIALNPAINGGAPAAGQDYFVKLNFANYIGIGDEDTTVKIGDVHAVEGMSASEFYAKLGVSLAKNLSREYAPLVKIVGIHSGSTDVEILPNSKVETLAGLSLEKLRIEEIAQTADWECGVTPLYRVNFTVTVSPIVVNGDNVAEWATIKKVAAKGKAIVNGYTMADLEYFAMGERGDQYRMMGYPNVIRTKLMIKDPTKAYDALVIHYAFVDSNEGVQKSERDMIFVEEASTNHVALDAILALLQ